MKVEYFKIGAEVLATVLMYEGARTILSQIATYFANLKTLAKDDVNAILINFENRLYEVEKKL